MRMMFAQQIQMVSADPISVGNRRFLPSVLVITHRDRRTDHHWRRIVTLRPVAVIEQQGEKATWYALPDRTQEHLSRMAGLALLIAGLGSLVLFLNWLLRQP